MPKKITVTEGEKQLAHKAMLESGGNKSLACEILGWNLYKLNKAIEQHRDLRERWEPDSEVPLVTPEESAGRTATGLPESPESLKRKDLALRDNQLTQSIERQDKALAKSLAAVGIKDEEAELVMSFEKFVGGHFASTIDILHGGLVKNSVDLMMVLKDIKENKLSKDLTTEEAEFWYKIYLECHDRLMKEADTANKAALLRATVASKLSGDGPAKKPGFRG